MKEGWEYKKLKDVGVIITGNTPSTKNSENYSSDEYCFVKPSDIAKDVISDITDSEYHVSKKGFETSRTLPKGSVLTTCIGIIGKVGILNTTAICNQQINAIIPNPSILPKYLAFAIFSIRSQLERMANAPVVPIINKGDFSNVEIPVPSLEEQERIVAELDLLTGIIDKQKAQLKELDTLAQSIFYDMFGDPIENEKGWEIKQLGDVCAFRAGKSIKSSELNDELSDGLFPCYGGNGIRGYIAKKSHHGCLPIIGRQGALCGNVNLASGDFYATEHAVVCTPSSRLNPIFLYYALTEMNLNQYAKGVAQPGLAVSSIIPLYIPIPVKELQESFAHSISNIEQQKESIKRSIAESQKLFDYTMDKYFG